MKIAASDSDPDDPPTPVPTLVPAPAHDEVEAGEPARAGHAQPRQVPRAPAKTRKRLRPPTSRQVVMGASKSFGTIMEKIAESNKESYEKVMNLIDTMNKRQDEKYKRQEANKREQERHDIDIQIKIEQLKLLTCKRRKYEEDKS